MSPLTKKRSYKTKSWFHNMLPRLSSQLAATLGGLNPLKRVSQGKSKLSLTSGSAKRGYRNPSCCDSKSHFRAAVPIKYIQDDSSFISHVVFVPRKSKQQSTYRCSGCPRKVARGKQRGFSTARVSGSVAKCMATGWG